MNRIILGLALVSFVSCKNNEAENTELNTALEVQTVMDQEKSFTIVFASCSDQEREQPLWRPILNNNPDIFIWGGDNIYADTDDMNKMKADYDKVLSNREYGELVKSTEVIGTWDDHDYGKNDAGDEWHKKEEAQQLFLDFIDIPQTDPLRSQKGVYYSKMYEQEGGSVKIVLLDTRTFRSPLNKSKIEGRRYDPWPADHQGTILGDTQWEWLQQELADEKPTFTIIVSSIQFLTDEHGWEKWGNYPSEVMKMYETLADAKSNNIIFFSGDRHLAEFSMNPDTSLPYPLIDFTTSGLTHTFPDSPDAPNRYRVGTTVKDLNFGVIKFDFNSMEVSFEIRGKENKLMGELKQQY